MNETHRLRCEDISDIVARRRAIMMKLSVIIDPEIEIANRFVSLINNPLPVVPSRHNMPQILQPAWPIVIHDLSYQARDITSALQPNAQRIVFP